MGLQALKGKKTKKKVLRARARTGLAGVPIDKGFDAVKDYFHLLTPRDDIFKEETLYEQYYINNGQRPDQISYKMYGDEQYYWIILQINEITDYFSQWPLSQYELDEMILSKYGSDDAADQIKEYRTAETQDDQGNIILPAGLKVSQDYTFEYRTQGVRLAQRSFPAPVTYREYEYKLNEEKSEIFILQPKFIGRFMREVKGYGTDLGNPVASLTLIDLQ